MIILLVYTFLFAVCFSYISKNQLEFENLTEEEIALIPYKEDPNTEDNTYFHYNSWLFVMGMVYGSTN